MNDRQFWCEALLKINLPVFSAIAVGRLKERMPVEHSPSVNDRHRCTHLEAFGRSFAGIAPWLGAKGLQGEEELQRSNLRQLVIQSISNATDSACADFMSFSAGGQALVDAAFFAHGLLRSYDSIWIELDAETQRRVIRCLKEVRSVKPPFNNWLLFSAMVEAFLCRAEEEFDRMRVDYAIRQHEQWYAGDGIYGDGQNFHWDYYNSFVIQPMLLDILESVRGKDAGWDAYLAPVTRRAQRYAAVQERLISPDASFPAIGRSLAYRFGAFQLLAQIALRKELPVEVTPAQVRCALTAVMRRMLSAPGTFDSNGWLRIGFCGSQPSIGERYISTGSLYLCSCVLLPLGLPPSDPFWSDAGQDWTSKKLWSGQDLPADHALSEDRRLL